MLARWFRRNTRPLPPSDRRRAPVRLHHFVPLLGFLLPSAAVGYGVVLPRSCAAGFSDLSIGFGATLVGAAVTYVAGVLAALRR